MILVFSIVSSIWAVTFCRFSCFGNWMTGLPSSSIFLFHRVFVSKWGPKIMDRYVCISLYLCWPVLGHEHPQFYTARVWFLPWFPCLIQKFLLCLEIAVARRIVSNSQPFWSQISLYAVMHHIRGCKLQLYNICLKSSLFFSYISGLFFGIRYRF